MCLALGASYLSFGGFVLLMVQLQFLMLDSIILVPMQDS